MIEASIKFGVRPSSLILGADTSKPWGKWDLLLAEAYQILQDERCPQCGLYRWICGNDDEAVQFDVVEESCVAIAEKDKYIARKYKGDKSVPVGTVVKPQPYMVDDTRDLMELREPYYKAQYKKLHPELDQI